MSAGGARVSVVIPAYNAARYLREAITSALVQTVAPFEVIVVDDGSSDGTAAVGEAFGPPVRIIRQANGGPAAAMNCGVEHGQGDVVGFLSADDRWATDKLERQLDALRRDDVDLVFGHVQHFVSPDLDPDLARTLRCPPMPMPARSAGTMLTTSSVLDRVGRFDERFRSGEFFEWSARADDLSLRACIIEEVVSWRRVHESNHSRTSRAPSTGYARVLKTVIDRRRAADVQEVD